MRKISLKLIVPLRLRKKLFTILLALAASVGVMNAELIDGIYYNIDYPNMTAQVVNGPNGCYTGDIVIPEYVGYNTKSYHVTSIGGHAFNNSTYNVTSVTIPCGVTDIGADAFFQCTALTDVYCYPNAADLTWDEDGSDDFKQDGSTVCHVFASELSAYQSKFAGVVNVTFVGDLTGSCGGSTPEPSGTTVTWTLEDMASMGTQGGYFKAKGITLMAYGVDNGMSGYGSHEGAFFGGPFVFTTSLGKFTKIEVTNSYLYEQPAFSGDDWTLDGTNAVWEGTPAALVSLVSNLGGITQIKFTISPNASTPANSCGDGLTWAVNNGVLTISYDGVGTGSMDNYDDYLSMPWYNETFSSVVLPEGLISIGQNAFAFINTFSEITLPSTLQYILMNAFSGCGLTSVTIPANVKGIGASAFISSQSLATVTFEPTTPPRVGGNAFENCNSNLVIYYPCESRAQYYKDMQADIAYYHDKMNYCPAPPSNLHVTELEPPASWSGKSYTYLAVADMPGFAEADSLLATEWEAPTDCNSVLIYRVVEQYGDYRMYYHYFNAGNFMESQDGWYPLGTIYSNYNNGLKTFYTSSAGGSTTPEIKLNANFGGTYDFADTEAFTDNGDGTATLSNIALEFGYYYNFRVKVDGVSMSDNHEFTRGNPSCVISSGSGDVYYFQADVTGNYSFTWEYATNTLTIGYPDITPALAECGLVWLYVPAGGVVGTIGHEDEVVLPQLYATNPDFINALMGSTATVRLGSTDEGVLKVNGFNNFDVNAAGECDVYVVHDADATFAYDSVAFHVTIYPAPTPAPTTEEVITNEDPENPSYHYSTFFHSTQNYKLTNDGTQAFIADLSGSDLVLTKIAEGTQVIPANTAVILRKTGSADPVVLTPTEENGVSFSANNDLLGVDAETAAPANCYVLSGTDQYGVGFYQILGNTLKAHKAYVIYTGSQNNAPRRMRFVFDTATDIDHTNAAVESRKVLENGVLYIIKNGVRYNAQGQLIK